MCILDIEPFFLPVDIQRTPCLCEQEAREWKVLECNTCTWETKYLLADHMQDSFLFLVGVRASSSSR